MWSIGVILFLLVCGYPPFNGRTTEEIFSAIKRGHVRFPHKDKAPLSQSVCELIASLLTYSPEDRLTAEQVLEHPWIAHDAATDRLIDDEVIKSLGSFRSHCRLKKAVSRVLSHNMTDEDNQHLRQIFKDFDANGDGELGPDEIEAMMKHIGFNEAQAQEWIREMDENEDGKISPEEFVSAAALGRLVSTEDVKKSFDMFDLNHDGFVTAKEIENVCGFVTHDKAQQLIKEVDANGDGRINFAEWLEAMKDIDTRLPATPVPISS